MRILPTNCIGRAKSAISSILPERFSFGRLKTQLCDSFERVVQKPEISSHDMVSANNIHIRDFIENPISRFKTNPELRKPIEQLVARVDRELAEVTPLKQEMIVYRGRSTSPFSKRMNRDFGIIANAQKGDIITPDFSYVYAEYTRPLAEIERTRHVNPKNFGTNKIGGIMYEIVLPEGSKVSLGKDVLIPREARYQILQKSQEQDGGTLVKMKYLLPEA